MSQIYGNIKSLRKFFSLTIIVLLEKTFSMTGNEDSFLRTVLNLIVVAFL